METQPTTRIAEFQARVKLGQRLSDAEVQELKEHSNTETMMKRPPIDFAEVELKMGAGLEGRRLKERNAEWERYSPWRLYGPEEKTFYELQDPRPRCANSFWLVPGGHERSMKRFRARLAELLETGRLPD